MSTGIRPRLPVGETEISDAATARLFFEQHFVPLQISRLGEDDGFVTGYYEPVLDGSRTQTDVYNLSLIHI